MLSESRSGTLPGRRLAQFTCNQNLAALVIAGSTPGADLGHAAETSETDILVVQRTQPNTGGLDWIVAVRINSHGGHARIPGDC